MIDNINWYQLVHNLLTRYKSVKSIEYRHGVPYQTMQRIALGTTKEPRWSLGVKLLDIHLSVCGADMHRELLK